MARKSDFVFVGVDFGEFFVGFDNFVYEPFAVRVKTGGNFGVGEGHDFYGEDGGVHGAVDAHSGNGDAGGHLYDRKQCIGAVEA